MRPPATCHPDRPHCARGLCRRCYAAAYQAGTLAPLPDPTLFNLRHAARVLGVPYRALVYAKDQGRFVWSEDGRSWTYTPGRRRGRWWALTRGTV